MLALVAVSCSSDSEVAGAPTVIGGPEAVESQNETATSSTTSTPPVSLEPADPVIRTAENTDPIVETNWVARTFMDDTRIDIVWSPVEGADTYRLFRLPTREADYEAIALGDLDGFEEVYEGLEFGFVDPNAPANTFLTYVLIAEVGDTTTEPRWTEALSIRDVTPPTPITGLRGTLTGEGVLLEWEPSFDDVEFAAYSVNVFADDGSLQYIGGGTEENQTSFIDNAAPSGSVTYLVQAFDFHDNGSEFAEVTVCLLYTSDAADE